MAKRCGMPRCSRQATVAFTTCDAHEALLDAAPALLEALDKAAQRLSAVAGLLATYPRPSQDQHGRILLDSIEIAKASAIEARAAIHAAKGEAQS